MDGMILPCWLISSSSSYLWPASKAVPKHPRNHSSPALNHLPLVEPREQNHSQLEAEEELSRPYAELDQ
ncbi:hypothetical protein EUGRSUZ_D01518 [Eucalyptus grandis]|uniref:Uncharacterized protein n=2 Tax=Eucalyptus grandis TaxID=71139 RepID=A0ACC3L603_EUCGR|nr:hypothetical protein EUGRSUZ_D01518 [Eucalyptus grandis]